MCKSISFAPPTLSGESSLYWGVSGVGGSGERGREHTVHRLGPDIRFTGGANLICDTIYGPLYRGLRLPRATFSVLVFLTGGPGCAATHSVIRIHRVGTGLISIGISGLIRRNFLRHHPIPNSHHGARLTYARGTRSVVRRNHEVRSSFVHHLVTKLRRRGLRAFFRIVSAVGRGLSTVLRKRRWSRPTICRRHCLFYQGKHKPKRQLYKRRHHHNRRPSTRRLPKSKPLCNDQRYPFLKYTNRYNVYLRLPRGRGPKCRRQPSRSNRYTTIRHNKRLNNGPNTFRRRKRLFNICSVPTKRWVRHRTHCSRREDRTKNLYWRTYPPIRHLQYSRQSSLQLCQYQQQRSSTTRPSRYTKLQTRSYHKRRHIRCSFRHPSQHNLPLCRQQHAKLSHIRPLHSICPTINPRHHYLYRWNQYRSPRPYGQRHSNHTKRHNRKLRSSSGVGYGEGRPIS